MSESIMQLQHEWKLIPLSKLVKYSKGKKPSQLSKTKTSEYNIPYINTQYLRYNRIENYSPKEEKLILVNKNEVLLLWDGANAGEFFLGKYGFLSSTMVIIKPLQNNLNFKYLFYMLKNTESQLRQFVQGTGIPHVSKEIFNNLEVPIPFPENPEKSLQVQQEIVDKLDKFFEEYEKLKEEKQKVIENYDRILAATISNLIPSNEEDLPEGWTIKKMFEIYDVRDGTHDSPKYQETGFPLVTSKNLKNGKLNYDKIKYISETDYININKRSKVDVGDVLFAMIGTIGNPVIIREEPKFAIKNVALFKVPEEQNSDFLSFYLQSSSTIKKMLNEAKGSTQKFVSLGYLRNFNIFLSKPEIQKQIVDEIKKAKELQDKIKEEQEFIQKQLEDLPKSVLAKAFRGELI